MKKCCDSGQLKQQEHAIFAHELRGLLRCIEVVVKGRDNQLHEDCGGMNDRRICLAIAVSADGNTVIVMCCEMEMKSVTLMT